MEGFTKKGTREGISGAVPSRKRERVRERREEKGGRAERERENRRDIAGEREGEIKSGKGERERVRVGGIL